jgi:hypothetical protein
VAWVLASLVVSDYIEFAFQAFSYRLVVTCQPLKFVSSKLYLEQDFLSTKIFSKQSLNLPTPVI